MPFCSRSSDSIDNLFWFCHFVKVSLTNVSCMCKKRCNEHVILDLFTVWYPIMSPQLYQTDLYILLIEFRIHDYKFMGE